MPDVVWWLTVLIALKILNGLYSGCQNEEPGFNILAIDSLYYARVSYTVVPAGESNLVVAFDNALPLQLLAALQAHGECAEFCTKKMCSLLDCN